ncbi:hypothetical protein DSCW_29930 [Desulfosarcina widdelii]|uniref:Tyrosine specific protein phosphatases domain-containing protein n=1 Tax=Desulfosarcina widdelii TaxID=947919 RepID=A0A5K7Z1L7_9BACT|nr:hypothetical protein DSCW_29930 [Desulfosarcina widdelii]
MSVETSRENTYPLKWVTKQVAVGYAPHSLADIEAIKSSGIEAVLNLCAECYDLHEIENAHGLDVHWLPITDEDAPQLEDAQKAIDWLNSKIGANKKVLIHCRFGIGRTGTVVMAWLLGQGYSADQAEALLDHTPSEPKSRRQWDFLDAYSKSIGANAIERPADLETRRSRLGKFFRKYILMNEWHM